MSSNAVTTRFPKSGNTWVIRLIAVLLQCPVEGFWNEETNLEIAINGRERLSDYRCCKVHQQLIELIIVINQNLIENRYKEVFDVIMNELGEFKVIDVRANRSLSISYYISKVKYFSKFCFYSFLRRVN